MMPVAPGKNAMGMNTAARTSVMPMMAPVIWPMAFCVASFGPSPSCAMIRSTFSITTMASSTRIPMARTIANMVSTLMENPATSITEMVPSRAIGTTIVGITV